MVVSETDIVPRLKKRDLAAYSELYDNIAPPLFQIILNLVSNKKRANKILQGVFIECWHSINLFDSNKESIFVWMVRIAIKHCRKTQELQNDDILERIPIKIPGVVRLFAVENPGA